MVPILESLSPDVFDHRVGFRVRVGLRVRVRVRKFDDLIRFDSANVKFKGGGPLLRTKWLLWMT